MFYVLLRSLYQDFEAGRSEKDDYVQAVFRLAQDYEILAGNL